MSTTYTGARAISAIANTTPIQVTTTLPHGLTTGAVVIQVGTLVAAANGQFTVTVVDSTHYTLNGTTLAGAGGAGGFAYTFPTSFTQPSDGEAAVVMSVDAFLDGLADCAAYLVATQGTLRAQVFTANGTFTPPPGVNNVILVGYGGGGGGGGGGNGANIATNSWASGGGGGGGALVQTQFQQVTPGTAYSVVVGAAGAAGTNTPTAGGDGGATTFGGTVTFQGGAGGAAGLQAQASATVCTPGGPPVAGALALSSNMTAVPAFAQFKQPSCGGFGLTNASGFSSSAQASAGSPSSTGCSPGAGGSTGGADSGSYRGGGTGGGGGAGGSLSGFAGVGGNGGNANGAGGASPGAAGTAGGANTGSGGGGGGGGGASNIAGGGAGGAGGAGGTGKLIVLYVAGPSQ